MHRLLLEAIKLLHSIGQGQIAPEQAQASAQALVVSVLPKEDKEEKKPHSARWTEARAKLVQAQQNKNAKEKLQQTYHKQQREAQKHLDQINKNIKENDEELKEAAEQQQKAEVELSEVKEEEESHEDALPRTSDPDDDCMDDMEGDEPAERVPAGGVPAGAGKGKGKMDAGVGAGAGARASPYQKTNKSKEVRDEEGGFNFAFGLSKSEMEEMDKDLKAHFEDFKNKFELDKAAKRRKLEEGKRGETERINQEAERAAAVAAAEAKNEQKK